MRRALVLAALVVFPAAARAQGMDGDAPRMPDPREMSGIPRPDDKVPKGTITVKLTRGELGRYAPAGSPVHLVEARPDGSIGKRVAFVDDEGRAEFPGLDAGGATVYWAFTVYNGDRLESEMVQLPPMVGVRMMLTSRKTDESGAPVGDPVDDAAQRELPQAPPGQIWVYLSRDLPAGTIVSLVDVDRSGSVDREAKQEGAHLVAKFTGVEPDPLKVFFVFVRHEGKSYRSRPFQLVATAGLTTFVIGGNQLRMQIQGGGQLDDEKIWFDLSFAVTNVGSSPHDPGPKGLFIPMPIGARNIKLQDEMSTRVAVADGGIVWRGLVPPGPNPVVVQFSLPVSNGKWLFRLPTPTGVEFARIAVERAGGATVSGESIQIEDHAIQGKPFWIVDTAGPPGGEIRFHGGGFPRRPRLLRYAGLVAGLVVLLFIGWAIAIALRPRQDERPSAASDAMARRELALRRDKLYDELVGLERRRAAGKIDPETYARERNAVVARLVVVHREIDAHEAAAGKPRTRA